MRLKITLKNGRSYVSQRIKSYEFAVSGVGTNRLTWVKAKIKLKGVLLTSINLNDIEAIEEI